MKRITASKARKQWFRLLDEVASGEVVVLERKGRRIVLRREEAKSRSDKQQALDYRDLLRVPDADQADQWTWKWQGEEKEVSLAKRGSR